MVCKMPAAKDGPCVSSGVVIVLVLDGFAADAAFLKMPQGNAGDIPRGEAQATSPRAAQAPL